jgi:hypothetical protein
MLALAWAGDGIVFVRLILQHEVVFRVFKQMTA